MSKHFIDSDMWEIPSFMDATPKHKLLAIFMVSKCDCAGIFRFNPKIAAITLGFQVSETDILTAPVDVRKISDFVFWLENYCRHQYGIIKSTCPAHRPVFSILARLGLLGLIEIDPEFDVSVVKNLPSGFSIDSLSIPYKYPIDSVKEQEQDKGQDPSTPKEEKNTGKGTCAREVKVPAEIPPALLVIPSFEEAWGEWVGYRKEVKKPVTPSMAKAQFAALTKLPDPVASIRQSIAYGWQGIFEVKEKTGGRTTTRPTQFKNQFDHASELGDAVRAGRVF